MAARRRSIPIDDYTGSLTAEGVPFEWLDADEVRRRWPQWRLDAGTTGLFQAEGGHRRSEPRQRRRTGAWRPGAGATLLERTPVTAIRDAGGGELEVATEDGATYRTPRVVIAADAWTNELLARFDRRLPLSVTREQVTWFAGPDPGAFAPDRFPIWIWQDEPSFYGFPTYGEAGPKGRPGHRRHSRPRPRPGRSSGTRLRSGG